MNEPQLQLLVPDIVCCSNTRGLIVVQAQLFMAALHSAEEIGRHYPLHTTVSCNPMAWTKSNEGPSGLERAGRAAARQEVPCCSTPFVLVMPSLPNACNCGN